MRQSPSTQGQDAFLDIVANLVGILIILVVIVGANAARVAKEAPVVDEALQTEIHQAAINVDKEATQLRKVVIDNDQLEQLIDQEKAVARRLTEVRHQRLVELETVRQAIKKKANQLDAADRKRLEKDAQVRDLQLRLSDLESSVAAASFHQQTIEEKEGKTIAHYPNPIALTVLSEEVHFCLRGGKLTWVPLDELVEEMKRHWRLIAENMAFEQTRQTIGPIGNYRLQYELDSVGTGAARRVQFRRFILIPVDGQSGELTEEALASDQSLWQSKLRGYNPKTTTVSIWVYPDSYAQHGQLKQWLHQAGYQMASWPLEHDSPIAGGPGGFRTAAQ